MWLRAISNIADRCIVHLTGDTTSGTSVKEWLIVRYINKRLQLRDFTNRGSFNIELESGNLSCGYVNAYYVRIV